MTPPHTKRNIHRKQRGSALAFSLGALVLGSILSVCLLSTSNLSVKLSDRRRDSENALHLAEAGMMHGFEKLADNRQYSGENGVKLAGASLEISVTSPSGDPTIKEVQCTATVPTVGGDSVRRTVVGTAQVLDQPPAWGFAMFSNKKLDLKQALIDSGPRSNEGNVQVNGAVKLHKGVIIDGRLTAVGPPQKKKPKNPPPPPPANAKPPKPPKHPKDPLNGAVVTEGYDLHAQAMPLPMPSKSELKQLALQNGEFWGDIKHENAGDQGPYPIPPDPTPKGHPSKDADVITLQGLIHGSVKIEKNAHVIVNGVVYVTGKVELRGESYSGSGAIVSDKDIHISKHENLLALDTSKVAFVSFSKKGIKIADNSQVGGGVYATTGKVKIGKGVFVYGSVAGQGIDVKKGGKKHQTHITRDTDYQPPYLGHFLAILGWREK